MSSQGRTHAQWEKNTVGPYRVLRRLRGVLSTEAGKLYSALRTGNGRRTLLVRPLEGEEHYFPATEWRLRVRAGPLPTPYVALEVEQAPQGPKAMEELADGLDTVASALEQLERHPDAAAHLLARPAPAPRQSTRWEAARPYWLALGAALAVAMLCVPRAWAPSLATSPAQEARASLAEEALEQPEELPVASTDPRAALPAVALDMPPKPFKNQYRVDAKGKCKSRLETPINGGCWVGLKARAPCGEDSYEWQGECYWPSMPSAKEPSTAMPPRSLPVPAMRSTQ